MPSSQVHRIILLLLNGHYELEWDGIDKPHCYQRSGCTLDVRLTFRNCDNPTTVFKGRLTLHTAASLVLAALLTVSGCHAQSQTLSPELARRIEILIRQRASLPFTYDVKVADRHPSPTLPGYDEVVVLVGDVGKTPKPITFLLSKDERTLAQLTTFDLAKDPRQLVGDAGRPTRGGGEKAPVRIVVFDDLECPFCARMHAQLFPALLNRYGDKVRIAYKDFPLSQHPWAIHAAIDADCLGTQNAESYWKFVDYLHAHAAEIGGQEKSLTAAKIQLDKITTDTGAAAKLDAAKLQACVAAQDESPVNAGLREGEQLSVNGVPALFINGESINGAAPIEFVYRAVDSALVAQGITPPPPVPLPDLNAPPPSVAPANEARPAGAAK